MWKRIKKIGKDNQLLQKLYNNYVCGRFWVPYPRQLMIVTTRKCNSRCKMCNIWNSSDGNDLKMDEYERILSQPLFKDIEGCTLTGGEAALRSDLVELADLLIKKLKKLKGFGIATNGLAPSLVIDKIRKISSLDRNKDIYVQISLDGIGGVHDEIRGIKGFFQRVTETIEGVKELKKNHKNIGIALSTVIQKDNVFQLDDIYDFARKKEVQIVFSPVILSENYYSNEGAQNIALTEKERRDAVDFLKNISQRESYLIRKYYRDVVIPILLEKKRKQRCLLGYDYLTIENDGKVPVCINAEEYIITDLKNKNCEKKWFSSRDSRKKCQKKVCGKCASACSMDCLTVTDALRLLKSNL